MKVVHLDIPEDHGYLIPIGDLHRGDKHLSTRGLGKLKGYLDWVMERPNAFVFLMGDILNVASRTSKTNPFESLSGDDEYARAIELFKPYASRIIGGVVGNHESRMYKDYGFNPLQPFCTELNIPYCGYSACVRLRVGKRPERKIARGKEYYQIYWGFIHHGVGGGSTLGAAINRKVKMQEIVHGMDFYAAGHDHQLIAGSRNVLMPKNTTIEHQRVHYIDTGSFLDWDGSYAEQAAMPIGKQGAPRLRFSGERNKHDLHVSL